MEFGQRKETKYGDFREENGAADLELHDAAPILEYMTLNYKHVSTPYDTLHHNKSMPEAEISTSIMGPGYLAIRR